MENHSTPQKLPNWLMLTIFLAIMTVLWVFGDLFTFILGLIAMAIIFSSGYDNNPANHEHH